MKLSLWAIIRCVDKVKNKSLMNFARILTWFWFQHLTNLRGFWNFYYKSDNVPCFNFSTTEFSINCWSENTFFWRILNTHFYLLNCSWVIRFVKNYFTKYFGLLALLVRDLAKKVTLRSILTSKASPSQKKWHWKVNLFTFQMSPFLLIDHRTKLR